MTAARSAAAQTACTTSSWPTSRCGLDSVDEIDTQPLSADETDTEHGQARTSWPASRCFGAWRMKGGARMRAESAPLLAARGG